MAAVSNAGGLGILASGRYRPEELRRDIQEVRELTAKPFGVNLTAGTPGYEQLAQVMLEEKVRVICHGRGNPKWLIEAAADHQVLIIALVGTVQHAQRAEQDGADIVVAAGMEGGGHVSHISTLVTLPLIASKVKIPVVAAGGFCDGRGLVAALALGAEGIAMGTRFAVTQESAMPMNIKEKYVSSSESDTVITPAITGTRLRVLRNRLTDAIDGSQGSSWLERISSTMQMRRALGVSWWRFLVGGWRMRGSYGASVGELGNLAAGAVRVHRAFVDGDADYGAIPAGQVCGRIQDIPPAGEVVARTMTEAEQILAFLKKL